MNIGKKLGQFKQWTGEKLGGSQRTETSDEFKQLEYVTEERKDQYEKLEHQLHNFIKSMSKGDGKEKDRSPMDMFGSVMTSVGTTLEASAYSKSLIQFGDAHAELANLQRAFINSVKDGYGEEMSQQMQQVKEYQKLKTKLENRRLDYDAKLNKAQKAKTPTPALEEDVRVAQTKYEETLQDITAGMIALNANEENQLSELCRFVDSEVEYFQAGLETLLKLQKEFAGIPRARSATSKAEFKRSISSASSMYDSGNRDSSISHTPAVTPPLGGSAASVGRLARSNSGFAFGAGHTGHAAPPPLPNRDPLPSKNQKQTRALYQFDAEGPGELSIRKGDLINVVEEVDEGWWIGELADGSGQRGMFPANYCEVVEPARPSSTIAPLPPTSTSASPRLAPSHNSGAFGSGGSNNSGPFGSGGRSFQSSAAVPARASIVPSRPSYHHEESNYRNSSSVDADPPACSCGCTEFIENAFKPGQCRSCFHKH
ncbi:hypothetical protein BDR26DRAFT_869725 [Obelidium mucronatum]|nr:hypothetical protein BDR26DRAFT_869725 [Obelidium mucronatum]